MSKRRWLCYIAKYPVISGFGFPPKSKIQGDHEDENHISHQQGTA